MKSKKQIEQLLRKKKPYLKKRFNVVEIGIFGSFARGEETEDSDVDILVTFSDSIGWEFVDLKDYLEDLLDLRVDLVTIEALKPQLREIILSEEREL